MKHYRTPAEQRAKMVAYYWQNRERLLEYQRKCRQDQKERDKKVFATPQEFYEDWCLSLIEKLETKKLPRWIEVGIIHMIMQINDKLNEMEQYEQTRKA